MKSRRGSSRPPLDAPLVRGSAPRGVIAGGTSLAPGGGGPGGGPGGRGPTLLFWFGRLRGSGNGARLPDPAEAAAPLARGDGPGGLASGDFGSLLASSGRKLRGALLTPVPRMTLAAGRSITDPSSVLSPADFPAGAGVLPPSPLPRGVSPPCSLRAPLPPVHRTTEALTLGHFCAQSAIIAS